MHNYELGASEDFTNGCACVETSLMLVAAWQCLMHLPCTCNADMWPGLCQTVALVGAASLVPDAEVAAEQILVSSSWW